MFCLSICYIFYQPSQSSLTLIIILPLVFDHKSQRKRRISWLWINSEVVCRVKKQLRTGAMQAISPIHMYTFLLRLRDSNEEEKLLKQKLFFYCSDNRHSLLSVNGLFVVFRFPLSLYSFPNWSLHFFLQQLLLWWRCLHLSPYLASEVVVRPTRWLAHILAVHHDDDDIKDAHGYETDYVYYGNNTCLF